MHVTETLNVVHRYGEAKRTLVEGPTKSTSGDRVLPMPAWLRDDLAAMLAQRDEAQRGLSAPLFRAVKGPGRLEARMAARASATTINRSLEVVRTILNRAARSYRDVDGRPWLDATPPLITMTLRSPYPTTWKEQDTLFPKLPAYLGRTALFEQRSYTISHTSLKVGRGRRSNTALGSPYPIAQMKLDFTRPPGKNSRSTPSLSKPDIGPQSRPIARAPSMKYAPCKLLFRNAETCANSGLSTNADRMSR